MPSATINCFLTRLLAYDSYDLRSSLSCLSGACQPSNKIGLAYAPLNVTVNPTQRVNLPRSSPQQKVNPVARVREPHCLMKMKIQQFERDVKKSKLREDKIKSQS